MTNSIKKIINQLTPWAIDNSFVSENYFNGKEAIFSLMYKKKIIGLLQHKNNKWFFKYSDVFIKEQFVLRLIDFPIIEKEYEFDELPPFFAARIPSLNQPFHKNKLSQYKGNKKDLVTLLEIFGEKTINNPFELKLN